MPDSPAHPGSHMEEDDEELILEGDVVDDLQGEDPEYGSEDEGDDGAEGEGEGRVHTILEDDSFHCFDGHQDAVVAVAWNPAHPDLVATGGCDDVAYLWRVGQDAFEASAGSMGTSELQGHGDTVAALAFSASGNMLATAGMDGVCKLWSVPEGRLLHSLEGTGGSLQWLAWHPRGEVVVAGTEDCMLYMWNAANGAVMQVFSGHCGMVSAGCFTPDGKAVVSVGGEGDSSLRVWNPRTGECSLTIQGHPFHEGGINCLGLHRDGSGAVITGGDDGVCCISNITTGRVAGRLLGHEDSVEAVGLSPHLPLAASGSLDGKLLIWDCGTLAQRGNPCEHPSSVTRMCWHPTDPLVFTACLDGASRCWDLRTGTCVRTYGGHEDAVQDICLSPDGSMLLTGADDGTARVFRVRS
ncbi:hypothetical protein HYH03_007323 [Edaphochlamys debaryana]|uniref:Angio-associated migratory cell protein n=1 Tax=Edaphochlamys debaryana TaxID=47281 RepID=A0A835Y5J3_9CHLO|nr:hypothetical protein HYH03_007323 [Edaphochlamys debaryana]|eukprot:KAG2494556.1 hypothetical protein HYH03_007323 [Edaphochlamys debaryana]